jgi:hypothetical protein
MNPTEAHDLTWHKSSYSWREQCVEVASTPDAVAVRDSKDPNGPALILPHPTFAQFLRSLR